MCPAPSEASRSFTSKHLKQQQNPQRFTTISVALDNLAKYPFEGTPCIRNLAKAVAMSLVVMSMTAQAEEPVFAAKSLFFGEDGEVKAVATGKASATEVLVQAPARVKVRPLPLLLPPREPQKAKHSPERAEKFTYRSGIFRTPEENGWRL